MGLNSYYMFEKYLGYDKNVQSALLVTRNFLLVCARILVKSPKRFCHVKLSCNVLLRS